MPTAWQKAIQRNCSGILDYLPDDITTKMFEQDIIGDRERMSLRTMQQNKGIYERNEEIVSLLSRRTDTCLRNFVAILENHETQTARELGKKIKSTVDLSAVGTSAGACQISDQDLKDQRALHEISSSISTEWNTLGINLRICNDRLQQIQQDNHRDSVQRNFNTLMEWWNKNLYKDREDRLDELKRALIESSRRDLSEKINDLFSG